MVRGKYISLNRIFDHISFVTNISMYLRFFSLVIVVMIFIVPTFQIWNNNRYESPELNRAIRLENRCASTQLHPNNNIEYLESNYTRAQRDSTNNKENLEFDPKTQYLIIVNQTFLDAIVPLSTWKHQKGVYTSIVTLEKIDLSYTGPDLPAKIHAFLREYHSKAKNLKWLLLVGDSEIIPARLLLTHNSTGYSLENISNYCYSDYYYSALDNTWDANSNQIYGESGEEDWVPELFVGRLPANNNYEVIDAVNKILTYEKTPPPGDWFDRSIQCGALMDRPNILDDPGTPVDEGYDWYKDNAYEVIRKIWNYLPKNVENLTYLDYNRIVGGGYLKKYDQLNASNVLTAFNSGASTVNFVSHGNDNGVLHYSGTDGKAYTYDYYFNHDIALNVENGFKLPLIYTSSCTSANFTETDDSNLEHLVTSAAGGAIGFIGATTDTYRLEFELDNASYGNWWLNAEFWCRFFNGEGNYRPGEILYKLKSDYYNHYMNSSNPHQELEYQPLYRINLFSYNLLGDPEIPIYTSLPTKLRVEHPQRILPIFRNHSLTIKVFDDVTNQAVDGAEVCLIGENIYLVNRTDAGGVAKFDLVIHEEKTLEITVSAHNYLYYMDNIEIEALQDLLMKKENIKFDRNPVPPGETVNISVEVLNNGSSELSRVKIGCYADENDAKRSIIPHLIIDMLPINGKGKVSFNWMPPPGSHDIIVIADVDDEIFEFNENNNIAETQLIENIPPIISNLPDKIMDEDTPLEDAIDLNTYTWDPDTDAHDLQFFIFNISHSAFNISINNSLLSLYPPLNWHGSVSVVAGVYDGTSSDTDDFTVIVKPVNDAPIINDTIDWFVHQESQNVTITPDHISVLEDNPVRITIVGYDIIDNDTELFYSAQTKLFNINSTTGEFSFLPDNSLVGSYEINFSVDDGNDKNNLAWRVVTLEVINTNDPPQLIFNEWHYLTVGEIFELLVKGTDLDPIDILKYRENTKLFEIDPNTGYITFKPKEKDIGTHQIKITVTDGNESVSRTLNLEIKSAPDEPLNPNYILICPSILIIILILLFIQEYLKTRGQKDKKKE